MAPPTFIPKRSNEPIEPGFPTILAELPATIEPVSGATNTTGRRAALAKWLTQADNPLTARVIVNRIWQSHFGRGLATNASDFGRLGESPTHPELLDWMTSQFVKNNWSLKSLHRLILNSATYRQSANQSMLSQFQAIDPANRYYWRGETRRLSAEKIRDAILAATGQLNDVRNGPALMPDVPCRTIFTRVMRNSPALLKDLKQRGMLDETLVVWGGEFGRTPMSERGNGRDHNPFGFTMWLAGGGVRGGQALGETDELGLHAVVDRVHVHDLHASILHLLGINNKDLTYIHKGRPERPTVNEGEFFKALVA